MDDPTVPPVATLRVLLEGLVEYAGLFPPAALPMHAAVENYAAYLGSPTAWMLGRFIVPVGRLGELATEASGHPQPSRAPWRLSALAGTDRPADVGAVRRFNAAHEGRLVIDTIELRASTAESVAAAHDAGREFALYVEIAIDEDPAPLLDAIARAGVRAKVRLGGTRTDAVPSVADVARFIARCSERGLPFKATAGLHHPLRGEYPVSQANDAPSATMFGFLNLFLAAAIARAGGESLLVELLQERDAAAFRFADDSVEWRGHRLTRDQLAESRLAFALTFGSCSFREPVEGLHALALL